MVVVAGVGASRNHPRSERACIRQAGMTYVDGVPEVEALDALELAEVPQLHHPVRRARRHVVPDVWLLAHRSAR